MKKFQKKEWLALVEGVGVTGTLKPVVAAAVAAVAACHLLLPPSSSSSSATISLATSYKRFWTWKRAFHSTMRNEVGSSRHSSRFSNSLLVLVVDDSSCRQLRQLPRNSNVESLNGAVDC